MKYVSGISSVLILTACQTTVLGNSPSLNVNPTATPAPVVLSKSEDTIKFFITGKQTSNLSSDRKTITLSINTVSLPGQTLKTEWSTEEGTLNTTRGNTVQWAVAREGTFTARIKISVSSSNNPQEEDLAYFDIPVVDGKILANEIAPEISVAPQTVFLFKPLPTELNLSTETQENLGIVSSKQLIATTYIYDEKTNSKVKKSGDFQETLWTSSNPSLVVVDDRGFIRSAGGSNTGTSIVTAASKTNSSSKGSAQITVSYLDTEINLSYTTTTLYTGGSNNKLRINSTIDYSNPTDRGRIIYTDTSNNGVIWRTSNPAMAQVDVNGNVTALADAATGDVTVTARSKYDPSITASVVLKVKGPAPVEITVQ